MVEKYTHLLNKIVGIQSQVQHLHPALEKLYPVAIVESDQLHVYNFLPMTSKYCFIKTVSSPMPTPTGLRAAFPLEEYSQQIACVVTPEIFESLEGYITILHEFVHCYQYEICEQRLKMSLDVARRAQETNNHLWEIEYPFPYSALDFIRPYAAFIASALTCEKANIQSARKQLKTFLGLHDYEYMVWQEWKEGFARWVENQVKGYLRLPTSSKGSKMPFSRVTFYAGGDALINCLAADEPSIVKDLPRLFARMFIP